MPTTKWGFLGTQTAIKDSNLRYQGFFPRTKTWKLLTIFFVDVTDVCKSETLTDVLQSTKTDIVLYTYCICTYKCYMYICICHMYLCIFIYYISSTTVTGYKRVWELYREHQGATFKHLAKKNHPLCGWRAKTDQKPVVGGGVFPFEIDHFSTTISLKVSIPKITSNWRDVPTQRLWNVMSCDVYYNSPVCLWPKINQKTVDSTRHSYSRTPYRSQDP